MRRALVHGCGSRRHARHAFMPFVGEGTGITGAGSISSGRRMGRSLVNELRGVGDGNTDGYLGESCRSAQC